MTITRRQAIRSLEAAGAEMAARGLPFTYRNYDKLDTLHSWNAVRRALGDTETGRLATIRDLKAHAGVPVGDRYESWEDHLSPIIDDVGPVPSRMYDDIRPPGAPSAKTLIRRSGLSWTEMISAVSDTDVYRGKIDWVDALIVMMDRYDTETLSSEEYDSGKDWNMPASVTIIRKAGSWDAAISAAHDKLANEDADADIDAWLAENKE